MANKFISSIPLIGGFFDDSEEKAQEATRNAIEQYQNLKAPELRDYNQQYLSYLGDFTPEDAKYQTVTEDPSLRSGQLSALSKMQMLSDLGFDAGTQAKLAQNRMDAAQQAQAARGALLDQARARGMQNSGNALALQEMANQSAANRNALMGSQEIAEAARNKMLANQQYLTGLGQMREQDFGNAYRNAEVINRFNQLNTAERNRAQSGNLASRQSLANQNVNYANQAQINANELAQQRYNNQMGIARAKAGAYDQEAQMYNRQAVANQGRRAALGKAIGSGIGFLAGGGPGAAAGGNIGEGLGGF